MPFGPPCGEVGDSPARRSSLQKAAAGIAYHTVEGFSCFGRQCSEECAQSMASIVNVKNGFIQGFMDGDEEEEDESGDEPCMDRTRSCPGVGMPIILERSRSSSHTGLRLKYLEANEPTSEDSRVVSCRPRCVGGDCSSEKCPSTAFGQSALQQPSCVRPAHPPCRGKDKPAAPLPVGLVCEGSSRANCCATSVPARLTQPAPPGLASSVSTTCSTLSSTGSCCGSPSPASRLPSPAGSAASIAVPAPAGVSPLETRQPQVSFGAALHNSGLCRPCSWYWKPQGCQNGEECKHCHLCPRLEVKTRKKNKRALFKD